MAFFFIFSMNSNRKIKVGLLVPYSGVHTNINTELEQGFLSGLEQAGANISIRWFPEYIQSGSTKDTEKALRKLILFDHVDLAIGIIGSKVILQLLNFIQQHQTPVVALNLGGYVPPQEMQSEYLFYNSLHLWQSQFALGKWTHEQWGGIPSVGMSIYEAGYDIHNTFRIGALIGGAENVWLSVLPYLKDSYNTLPLIEVWKEQKPTHVHALLSGKEGDQFLQNFAQSDLKENLHLTVNPFMVEDGKLAESAYLKSLQLANAATWFAGLQNTENQKFVQTYTEQYNEMPGVYSLMAYETGLTLGTFLAKTENNITKKILTVGLQQNDVLGPRGIIQITTNPVLKTKMPVYIRTAFVNQEQVWENTLTETVEGIEWNDSMLEETRLNVSGWQNPYLCV